MEQNKTTGDFNSVTLLLLLWRWRMKIIIVLVLTVVISAVVSLMMTERFKSTAIIFPAKSNAVVLGKMISHNQGILQFGEEGEAEQLLQVLNSSAIRDRIVKKFNLMDHYEIDTTSPYKNYYLTKEYQSNVICSRTRYGSVTIDVMDTDPQMAADIANEIVVLVDSAKNQMLRERAGEGFKVVEAEYMSLLNEIATLNDTLTKLSILGVMGSSSGQAALMESYSNAIKERNTALANSLSAQLEVNRNYGAAFTSFAEQRELKNNRLDELEGVYQQAKADANSHFPQKFVVETATKAERKSYPVRWLIVAVSTFSSFFFMIFFIIALEKIKELRAVANEK